MSVPIWLVICIFLSYKIVLKGCCKICDINLFKLTICFLNSIKLNILQKNTSFFNIFFVYCVEQIFINLECNSNLMKIKWLFFVVLVTIITTSSLAQDSEVSGVVSSIDDGMPLIGANVIIDGTSIGTTTDFDGKYSIAIPEDASALVFSYIGYADQTVEIAGRSEINVALEEITNDLEGVVVTGYGNRAKTSFTGSAAAIDIDKIEGSPLSNIESALQGNIAGVQLGSSSGTPGSTQDIRIRGVSSITAGNDPLYVIDGVPVSSGNAQTDENEALYGNLGVMASLSPNDIASITVLKDASATALYGARGSNGVIVITTKKGKSSKPVFTFSTQVGTVDRAVEGPQMLNAEQYAELYYEAVVNEVSALNTITSREEAEQSEIYALPWDGVTNTNFRDIIKRDNAITQNYDFSMRGGNDKSNYYASLGHFNQDGINNGVDFKRTTGKLYYGNQITEKIYLSNSLTGSYIRQNGQLEGSRYLGNPDASSLYLRPIFDPYNEDGSLNIDDFTLYYNPVFQARNTIHQRDQTRFLNSTTLSYYVTDKLKFSSILGLDYLNAEELHYDPIEHGDGADVNGQSFAYNSRNFNWTWRNMLDYSLTINPKNKIDFKVAYEAQKNTRRFLSAGGNNIATNELIYPTSTGNLTLVGGGLEDWAINSILTTATYSWNEEITIDGTFRREGNSRFSSGFRWGTFYSLGAAWSFSNRLPELDWLDNSKLRVSYGRIGNASIGINQNQELLAFSAQYNNQSGSFPSQYGNNELGWENSDNWNLGLDFGLFGRITGTVEYFNRKSTDLLLFVPVSSTTGFPSQLRNVGEMVNQGLEFSLNSDIVKTKNFNWNLGFNFTTLKNEVTSLPRSSAGAEIGIVEDTYIVTEGEAAFSWFMPTWAGVDSETGTPLWYVEGQSGETTSNIGEAQSSVQGTPFPDFYGGAQTRFDYKGVYLSASVYYSTGNKIYDTFGDAFRSDGQNIFGFNDYASQLDRWQQPGDIAKNPQVILNNTSGSRANSTRYLHDGEFLRLRDVTIGYQLPEKLMSKIPLTSVSFYVKGTNLLTYVADKDLEHDPETSANGFILLNAPPLKTLIFGAYATF